MRNLRKKAPLKRSFQLRFENLEQRELLTTASIAPLEFEPVEGQQITFQGSSDVHRRSDPYYRWDFGDGTSAEDTLRPRHIFTDNGTYMVTFTVSDRTASEDDGSNRAKHGPKAIQESWAQAMITVNNAAPIPTVDGPYEREVGSPISFTGIATDPSEADIDAGLVFAWDFGDGAPVAEGANPTHTYDAPGTYDVILTVTDKDGSSGSVATTSFISSSHEEMLVTNEVLDLGHGAMRTITPDLLYTTDVDTPPAELIYMVSAPSSQGVLQLNGALTTTFSQADVDAERVTYQHDGGQSTTDQFEFSVDDGQGMATMGVFLISIDPPVPNADSVPSTLSLGDGIVFYSDDRYHFSEYGDHVVVPHDDSLLLDEGTIAFWFKADDVSTQQGLFSKDASYFGTGGHVTFYLQDGRGHVRLQSTSDERILATDAQIIKDAWHHLSLSFGPNGMTLYLDGVEQDHDRYAGGLGTSSGGAGNFEPLVLGANSWRSNDLEAEPVEGRLLVGEIDETVIVDHVLTSSELSTLIRGVDDRVAPVAIDSMLETIEGVSLEGSVTAHDANGDELSYVLVETTSQGTLEFRDDGSFAYLPHTDYYGSDSFRFRANDGSEDSNIATVSITVFRVNEEEQLVISDRLSTREGTTTAITAAVLRTTDAETAPNQLIYSVSSETTNGALLLGAATTSTFTQADVDEGRVTYQHNGTETIEDQFDFIVDDGEGTTTIGTLFIDISPVNDEQVLVRNSTLYVEAGATGMISRSLLETTDVDNAANAIAYTITAGTRSGTVRLAGAATSTFTQSDVNAGLITYQHNGSQTTSDSFNFTVDDAQGTSSNGTFNVSVTPVTNPQTPFLGVPTAVPGIIEVEDYDNGSEGVAYHDNVPGNSGSLYRSNEDVDIISLDDSAGGGYVIWNFETGEWMEYTIQVPVTGDYRIDVRASSGFDTSRYHIEIDGVDVTGSVAVPNTGGWGVFQDVGVSGIQLSAGTHVLKLHSDEQYFNVNYIQITGESVAPVAASSTLPTVEGGVLNGLLSATDANGDPLTYQLNSSVSNGLLSFNVDGSFTYTPNAGFTGNDSFTFHANDGTFDSNIATVTIDVQAVTDEEVLTSNSPLTIDEGATETIFSSLLSTTDTDNTPAELAFSVTGGPVNGTIQLNGSSTTTFTQADINAGWVTYQHSGNETTSDSFGFNVNDAQGPGTSGTFNINVTPVNDEEILSTNNPLSVTQGGTATIGGGMLTTTDADNSPAELTYSIIGGPSNGTVLLSGSATTAFTQADINAGLLTYLHDGSQTISDSFFFRVDDGHGTSTSDTFDINVGSDTAGVALPQDYVDTTYAPPTGGTTHVVNAGDNLQTVLNAAQPGDIIELEAGATFTGNFILPNKTGNETIMIRTSAHANLPAPGTRVSPADAVNMARIRSDNDEPALTADHGSHDYHLVGIEITSSAPDTYNLVLVGFSNGNAAGNVADLADNIIFDRVYIHGSTSTRNIQNGIIVAGGRFGIVDSYVSEITSSFGETIGVHVYRGAGPMKIDNNFISAATHNLFLGDDDTFPSGLLPSDITITRNHLFKPLGWQGVWKVKNIFEIKGASRVLLEGNVFENNWADAQAGYAILYTPRGGAVSDVTFRSNIVKNSYNGFQITAAEKPMSNLLIENNLIYDIDHKVFVSERSGGGAVQNFTIRHNTITGGVDSSLFYFGEGVPAINGLVFHDSITEFGAYGFLGDGQASGLNSVSTYTTDYDFDNNVLIGGLTQTENSSYRGFMYASNNESVGFEGGQLNDVEDFRLSASSPYRNAATDGRDIGADIDAILAAMM